MLSSYSISFSATATLQGGLVKKLLTIIFDKRIVIHNNTQTQKGIICDFRVKANNGIWHINHSITLILLTPEGKV